MDYNRFLSDKIGSLKPSGIRRFFDVAEKMEGVISLGIGQPDFKTPWHIRAAGIATLERGLTSYTSNSGLTELKLEISHYLKRRFSLTYNYEQEVMVTVGGSEAIDICLRTVLNPGDKVLVPEPCFVCYAPLAILCGAEVIPVPVKSENQFKITPEDLAGKIDERTKLLVLPFPNNPTGAVMRRDDLEEIAAIVKENDLLVLSDEIYCELTYGSERHVSIASLKGMRERTIVVNGFSKSYAMTGWRLGYACGPAPIIAQMLKVHQYAIMCAPTTAQYAGIDAVRNGDESVAQMVAEYDMRRRYLVDALNALGLTCFNPEGAFYVFPSITKTGMSSEEFCDALLKTQRVAVIPGTAFGENGEGFVRICYAYSLPHLMEAVRRIDLFLQNL